MPYAKRVGTIVGILIVGFVLIDLFFIDRFVPLVAPSPQTPAVSASPAAAYLGDAPDISACQAARRAILLALKASPTATVSGCTEGYIVVMAVADKPHQRIVVLSVDAPDRFGATRRHRFVVTMDGSGQHWEVTNVTEQR